MQTFRFPLTCVLLSTLSLSASTYDRDQQLTGASGSVAVAKSSISAALGRDMPAYYARATGGGLETANPRHKLCTRFTSDGVELRAGAAYLQMKLAGYGYGAPLTAVEVAAPRARANRVEYHRGPVTEWYLNGPAGLEQGFTLSEPSAKPTGEPLTIALALSGNLTAIEEKGGAGILLAEREGRVSLRYGGLTAYDNAGKQLHSRMELKGDHLIIKVEDADARYPIVIDPLVELAELTASDAIAGDSFGAPAAISGNTLVVGATGYNGSQGAAYVFVKPVTGWANTSNFAAKLTASDGIPGDNFGIDVAVDKDTVVVGAFGSSSNQGAAYVFVKPSAGWATTSNFEAKLTASDGTANDFFGERLAVNGNTVVAGANRATVDGVLAQGAAYVFVKPRTGWATTSDFAAKLTSSDGAASLHFGFVVCVISDTIVVTSDLANIGSNTQQGAAYVFIKPKSGWATTSTFAAKLTASDGQTGDIFGYSASLSSGTLVIGEGVGLSGGAGAAYVFVKPPAGWTTTSSFNAKLTDPEAAAGDFFGGYVAASGNGVLVGAPFSAASQGVAYLFVKPKSGWATTSKFKAKLTASDGAAGDNFGWVAASGNTRVVGAYGHNGSQGAVYVFGP